jgi:hypothetical protein
MKLQVQHVGHYSKMDVQKVTYNGVLHLHLLLNTDVKQNKK